jgi:DNA-binding NtrC family response regulator
MDGFPRFTMDGGGATTVVRDVVAIIDDEPLVLRALTRILAGGGHRLVTASRVEDLGDLLCDPSLAVVLLDLFMGEAGGLDALARIRGQRPDVEVVVMTGRASVESAVLCMRAGAFDYLSKPFSDIDRVRDAVDVAKACAAMADGADAEAGIRVRVCRDAAGPTDWTRVPLASEASTAPSVPLTLEAYERLALERALHEAAGDAAEAARRLGIGRSTFYRKAAKLGVDLQRRHAEAGRTVDCGPRQRPPWFGGGASIS